MATQSPPPPPLLLLPPELLSSILTHLPLPTLLTISRTCLLLHHHALSALERRHRRAQHMPHHHLSCRLALPAARYSTRQVVCGAGIDAARPTASKPSSPLLNPSLPSSSPPAPLEAATASPDIRALHARYTSFPPLATLHPNGTAFATSSFLRRIALDADERFAQFVFRVEIVPRRSWAFKGGPAVVGGVVRVFRGWLEEGCARSVGGEGQAEGIVLWLDERKDVGVRAYVERLEGGRWGDEDAPVQFGIEFTEVLVRSTSLVHAYEQCRDDVVATGAGFDYLVRGVIAEE